MKRGKSLCLTLSKLGTKGFLLMMVVVPEHTRVDKHTCTQVCMCGDTEALHAKWGTVYLGFLSLAPGSVTELPH